MATATFIHDGDAIDYTPAVDVPAGTIVRHGFWIGAAKQAIAANKRGSLAISGVFDVPKPANQGIVFAVGGDVYWSVGSSIGYPGQLDPGDAFMGLAVEAAPNEAATVRVRLQPAPNSHSAV